MLQRRLRQTGLFYVAINQMAYAFFGARVY